MLNLLPILGVLMFSTQVPDLQQLQWHKRVVLVFSASVDDPRLLVQRQTLQQATSDLQERDMVVFELIGNSLEAEAIRTKLGVTHDRFAVTLVGKDGSRKLRRTEPVSPSELFRLVDSMPMRRDEMRRKE